MLSPRFPQDPCLILSDSGVESLLACALASEQQQLSAGSASMLLAAWWGQDDVDLDLLISAIEPALIHQASTYGLRTDPQRALFPPDEPTAMGLLHTRLLTEAASIALLSGFRRVVWPVRAASFTHTDGRSQEDLIELIGTMIDRALLVSRLVSLDATPDTAVEVVIETPFVDLTDEQLYDLSEDLSIPIETCWWHSARTLPAAQRIAQRWASIPTRSSLQIEPKPGSQTRV